MKRVERTTFTCQYKGCGKLFQIRSTELKRRQPKYCSQGCQALGSRVATRLTLTCQNTKCNKTFESKLDHGKTPKFCSRECFLTQSEERTCAWCTKVFSITASELRKSPRAGTCCSIECQRIYFTGEKHNRVVEQVPKTCLNDLCGELFFVSKLHSGLRKYCSNDCRIEDRAVAKNEYVCANPECAVTFTARDDHGKQRFYCCQECYFKNKQAVVLTRSCMQCNTTFQILESHTKSGPRRGACCSMTCSKLFFKGKNGVNWKGGIHKTEHNGPAVFIERDDRKCKRIGQHRLIAEEAIGRRLHRTEIVLRLDRNNENNDPANIYICKDTTHAGKLIHGSKLAWPSKSNLDTYR